MENTAQNLVQQNIANDSVVRRPKYTFEQRMKIRARIKELADAKLKLSDIVAIMNREGFTCPDGRPLDSKALSAQAREAGIYFSKPRSNDSKRDAIREESPQPETVSSKLEQILLLPHELCSKPKPAPEIQSAIDQVRFIRFTLGMSLPVEQKLNLIAQAVGVES